MREAAAVRLRPRVPLFVRRSMRRLSPIDHREKLDDIDREARVMSAFSVALEGKLDITFGRQKYAPMTRRRNLFAMRRVIRGSGKTKPRSLEVNGCADLGDSAPQLCSQKLLESWCGCKSDHDAIMHDMQI